MICNVHTRDMRARSRVHTHQMRSFEVTSVSAYISWGRRAAASLDSNLNLEMAGLAGA